MIFLQIENMKDCIRTRIYKASPWPHVNSHALVL